METANNNEQPAANGPKRASVTEIDLRVPRRVSFSKNTESVLIESTTSEDTKLDDGDLLLAATYVKDAMAHRNMNFKTDEKSVRSYNLFNHPAFKWILFICIWANLALAIFEKPAVYAVAIPYWGTMIMETAFLGFFVFRFCHAMYFDIPGKFWRDPKNITVLVTIVLTFIDMFTYIMWVHLATPAMAKKAVRWSRLLRPLYLINFPEGRQLRQAFRNIRKTLPDVANVLILFLCSIGLFALMGLKLLQKRGLTYPNGRPYFSDYWESFWDLYVLVTTANNPDVMMPAYDLNNWFALFFICYTIICLYIFMSIVLAVIYNNYRRHLKAEVMATVYTKRRALGKAFDILKVWKAGCYKVTKDRWHSLLKVVAPKRSTIHVDLLLYVLDDNGDECIERREFLQVADLLLVELSEVKDRMTFLEKYCPGMYMSKPSELLKTVVRHRFFRYFFDLMILINAICIGFGVDEVEWFFLALFLLEIILKLYTKGPKKFFTKFWDVFDFVVIGAAFVATLIERLMANAELRSYILDENNERTLDFLLVFRVLRLIRLMGSVERALEGQIKWLSGSQHGFKIVITTIVNIGPSILTYGAVIFVFYYIYAILGMEIFNGMIKYYGYTNLNASTLFCGNQKLNGSEFFIKRYCNNNFNDIFHSIVLLFELMVVNQWHVLSEGFVLVTNLAARLYFISFHMIVVVVLLNIFTAFVLEIFLLEYTLSRHKFEDAVQAKIKDMGLGKGQQPTGRKVIKTEKKGLVDEMETIEDIPDNTNAQPAKQPNQTTDAPPGMGTDTGLRFRLRKKSKKKIGELLQHMFEDEIDPTDEGPDGDLDELPLGGMPRRLTLDTVS